MITHRCKKHGKSFCGFCIGTMVSFPIEHGIYKFVPGFSIVGHMFGM